MSKIEMRRFTTMSPAALTVMACSTFALAQVADAAAPVPYLEVSTTRSVFENPGTAGDARGSADAPEPDDDPRYATVHAADLHFSGLPWWPDRPVEEATLSIGAGIDASRHGESGLRLSAGFYRNRNGNVYLPFDLVEGLSYGVGGWLRDGAREGTDTGLSALVEYNRKLSSGRFGGLGLEVSSNERVAGRESDWSIAVGGHFTSRFGATVYDAVSVELGVERSELASDDESFARDHALLGRLAVTGGFGLPFVSGLYLELGGGVLATSRHPFDPDADSEAIGYFSASIVYRDWPDAGKQEAAPGGVTRIGGSRYGSSAWDLAWF